MLAVPQIVVHPEKRYSHGKPNRGARRGYGSWARTLALLDTLGIRKRPVSVHIRLSEKTYKALVQRAVQENVSACGLATYIVESAMRETTS